MFESCFNQIFESITKNYIIGVCGGVAYQLVGLDMVYPLIGVFIALVADMISGITLAIKRNTFSISVMVNKFIAKVLGWSLIIVTTHQLTVIEPAMKAFEGFTMLVLAGADLGSVVMNLKKAKTPIPSALIDMTKKVKDKSDKLMKNL